MTRSEAIETSPDAIILPGIAKPQHQPDHTLIHGFTKVIDLQQIRQDLLKPRRRWLTLAASAVLLLGGLHLIQAVYNYQQSTNGLQQSLIHAEMAIVQEVSEPIVAKPDPIPLPPVAVSRAIKQPEINEEKLTQAEKSFSIEELKEQPVSDEHNLAAEYQPDHALVKHR